ncbi:hypothetical protein GCK32_011193 [Trichostrongylus colubriformis]|uniref:Uncharacterized protein n=1 Tax=Trichostrongylus colubriformis TaxID=6319 RepID=A0AAN8FED7_TRICO
MQRSSAVPSFDKLVVEKDPPDSRVSAPFKEVTSATQADEDWELKFYERVKQDPAVPSYFKTTFGILVANNRDLRAERAFLHNHLNRK